MKVTVVETGRGASIWMSSVAVMKWAPSSW